jgi:outer membrane receptor protein involved in Fe transport
MQLKRSVLLTSLALAAVTSASVHAQTAPAPAKPAAAPAAAAAAAKATDENASITNIVVTARRVDELLIDVPLTIQAFSGRDLAERNIANITDLAQFTPGLSYSPDFGRVSERPVIRGISALRPEAPQPVSVFIDGVFVREGALSLLLDDAQRVEVIKGPQSALYGRSTYAGAINYVTNKPGNALKGSIVATAAQAREFSGFGAITLPIIKDGLSIRLKAKKYEYGGQYINTQTGNRIGKEKTESYGAAVSFIPTSWMDGLLTVDQSKDDDGFFNATARPVPTQAGGVVTSQNGSTNIANGASCNGRTLNIVGNNAAGLPDPSAPLAAATRLNGWPCGAAVFQGRYVTRNENDLQNYTDPATGINYGNIAGTKRQINRGALTMNFRIGDYTLTTQSAITRNLVNVGADQSYNGTRFAITGASWTSYNRDRIDYTSHEVRLTSPEGKPFEWMVGGFYYDENTEGKATGVIARNATGAVVADPMRNVSATSVSNVAPFARMQYEFNKQWRISVEGRQNKETVSVGGTPLGNAIVTSGTCVAGQVCTVTGERTFKQFTPRVTLDFKMTPDTMLYGQYATGFKSGGFNTTAGLPASVFAFNGEKVRSMEFGMKTAFMKGQGSFTAAVFNNEIDQLQLSNISTVTSPLTGVTTTTTIVNNVGKARTRGFEFDTSVRVLPWLTLAGNYAFTDAKAKEGTETTNGTAFGGNQSVAGFYLPRSPKHSASGSVAVDAPITNTGLRGFARVDVVYQSRRYAEIQNMIWADPYTRINLSAGVRTKTWKVNFWMKNAANDDTSLNGFRYLDAVTFRRTAVDFLPKLRQAGVTVNYDF